MGSTLDISPDLVWLREGALHSEAAHKGFQLLSFGLSQTAGAARSEAQDVLGALTASGGRYTSGSAGLGSEHACSRCASSISKL